VCEIDQINSDIDSIPNTICDEHLLLYYATMMDYKYPNQKILDEIIKQF
jgi:hypothetical protein